MTLPELLSVGSLLVSVAGLLWVFFGVISGMKEKQVKDCGDIRTDMAKQFGEIKAQMAVSDLKIGLFWKRVDEAVTDMLHQPIHFEKDALLEKWRAKTITEDEIDRLYEIINEEQKLQSRGSPLLLGYALLLARLDSHFLDRDRSANGLTDFTEPAGRGSLNNGLGCHPKAI